MFRFKQFTVADEQCAMKVGTDGVLLGAWVDLSDDDCVLDVGTGTGLIALMVAQRATKASIVAIDIDADAARQARANADNTPWAERITTFCCDVRGYESDAKFDHIVSNPPYFVDLLTSPNAARTVARHTSSLHFGELIDAACGLLRRGGRLSVILPADGAAQMRREAFGRLWLVRQTDVVTIEGDAPKRTMMEFRLCDNPVMPRCDRLIIHNADGSYTDKYRLLTEDFYLKF